MASPAQAQQREEVRVNVPTADDAASIPTGMRWRRAWAVLAAAATATAVAFALALAVASTSFGESGQAGELPEVAVAPRVLSDAEAASSGNPFVGQTFYVNPSYRTKLTKSIALASGTTKDTLTSMLNVPSAYWLDSKAKISGPGDTGTMEGILQDAEQQGGHLVVFIVYDLPNRDCHAKASNGEICCKYKSDGSGLCDYEGATDCEAGLNEYKTEYIDAIASKLAEFEGKVPVVLIIEPDSLPNLSTNKADIRCGNAATQSAYTEGITYAVQTLKTAMPSVTLYLDAGHGGWLGWKDNMADYVTTVKGLGITQYLRGFSQNVAGYSYLGVACPQYDWCLNNQHPQDVCCTDPCRLLSEWNPSQNEHNYALHLQKAFSEGVPGFEPHMIIDTGRNGVADERSQCKNWCNIRDAGVGLVPTARTELPFIVDAYFWLKTPGESDGCTQTLPSGQSCKRFDQDCASQDSLGSEAGEPRAPEAGEWFDYQIQMLARNAHMTKESQGYEPDPEDDEPVVTTTRKSKKHTTKKPKKHTTKTTKKPKKRRTTTTTKPAAVAPSDNPFVGRTYYVNPSYRTSLQTSIDTSSGTVKSTLKAMRDVPSAYWLDTKAKLKGTGSTKTMEGILQDADANGGELVVFIVYDLPNRDCHAKASNGEICCTYNADGTCDYDAGGDCADGLDEYKIDYIDVIADLLAQYADSVPIVLIIEPDSLPNLSTNKADPHCGNSATEAAYTKGISYAVKTLAEAAPSITMYLDSGHGGWLGWNDNMQSFVETIGSLGVTQYLRGFSSNVAGYQSIGQICPAFDWCLNNQHPNDPCCADPCKLLSEWNPSQNELNYALHLRTAFQSTGFVPHMVIDSGRNAVADARAQCKNWCNIRGAGAGLPGTADTASPDLVDAYFWLKTPGESDGCTQTLPDGGSCKRFDQDCASVDSIGSRAGEPHAPEAGAWFDYQVKMLAANAKMS